MIEFTGLSSVSATYQPLRRDDFRRACSKFATGITVVSVCAPDGSPHGLTANSFTSVSAEPPLILVCIDVRCRLLPHFAIDKPFAVNILSQDQEAISVRFAESPDARFDGVEWERGSTGVPLLGHTIAGLECSLAERIEAGDHAILIGEVLVARTAPALPLVYFNSRYAQLQSR